MGKALDSVALLAVAIKTNGLICKGLAASDPGDRRGSHGCDSASNCCLPWLEPWSAADGPSQKC